ncbi:hypothetical protein VIGAN_06117200 [Vigna angularis var. angularis]|uniref:Uncharacterized protein n=1 Tax=Vigna angularis var. angularis TaxID=157739 RepID=A0A0S3SAY3_PHAAN|nr:hypothetical protein VIGAN_06117200 [Vigna angularis var. angularis]
MILINYLNANNSGGFDFFLKRLVTIIDYNTFFPISLASFSSIPSQTFTFFYQNFRFFFFRIRTQQTQKNETLHASASSLTFHCLSLLFTLDRLQQYGGDTCYHGGLAIVGHEMGAEEAAQHGLLDDGVASPRHRG